MNAAQLATETRRQQAEGRLRVIRNALGMADEELAKVVAGRDWEAFDLASFEDYCAEFLPEMRFIKLRVDRRLARTKALLEANPNLTEREVGAATGASPATAHRDVLAVTGRSASNEASPALLAEDVAALTNWQSVVRHVGRAGQRGQTCLEFEVESAWGHGKASAAFHAAERKGYISRDGRFRGPYAVYVRSSAQ